MNKQSIAIYSANFGNYRNEYNKSKLDDIKLDKEIDYYYFTDNKNIQLNNWKVIHIDLKPTLDFIDSFRHTSKFVKFVVPEILHKYDIVVWIDTKSLSYLPFKYNKITELLQTRNMCFIKHPDRVNPQQEINITISMGLEHKENALLFLNKIKLLKFKSELPDTTCIIYKNNNDNICLLKNVYNALITNGLRRDQNIIQYVLQSNNFESKISYYNHKNLK